MNKRNIIVSVLIFALVVVFLLFAFNYYSVQQTRDFMMQNYGDSNNSEKDPYSDAGKVCTSSSECLGWCIADGESMRGKVRTSDGQDIWGGEFRCPDGCTGICSKFDDAPNMSCSSVCVEQENGVCKKQERPFEVVDGIMKGRFCVLDFT